MSEQKGAYAHGSLPGMEYVIREAVEGALQILHDRNIQLEKENAAMREALQEISDFCSSDKSEAYDGYILRTRLSNGLERLERYKEESQ